MNRHVLRFCVALVLCVAVQRVSAQSWTGPILLQTGAEEKVFTYTTDHCTQLDLPDVYAHPIRTPDGLLLISGNAPSNYAMFGPDFRSLRRSCTPVFVSGDKWDVTAFDHQEWITSVYSEDGVTIHALVHNEYHDPYSARCRPGVTDPSNPCWYNFISYAVSTDAGRTFTQPASPGHLVAMLPFKWNPDASRRGAPPPHGYMEPSNIVRHDGYYYCMMFGLLSNTDQSRRGTCIMRTDDITRPASWRLWDGAAFSIPLVNPYTQPPADSSAYLPAFVSPQTLRDLRGSLTWNSYLRQFVLVGAGVFPVSGVETCGVFLSRSSDLLQWSPPKLIRKTVLGWSPCNTQTPDQAARNITQEAYPSLIDHDAPDVSFTSADSTAYIYFMQNMDNHTPGGWGFRRDLVRIPLTIQKVGATSIATETHVAPAAPALSVLPQPGGDNMTVVLRLEHAGPVRLEVFDVFGTSVMLLFDESCTPGTRRLALNFPPGDTRRILFLRAVTAEGFVVRKLVR